MDLKKQDRTESQDVDWVEIRLRRAPSAFHNQGKNTEDSNLNWNAPTKVTKDT